MYEMEKIRRPQSVTEVGRECAALYHTFGCDLSRKGNLAIIEDNTIIYATGSSVVFENILGREKRYLMALDEGGVGCVAVHPSRQYFAVGGKGHMPRIYIYSYPDLKVIKVLNGGAERGYTSLTFNAKGNKLASVASSPDYMLTIWDWESEQMGLHAKAFGQDVYAVRFSVDDERRLTTSGTGHIRFWKMASTFTGLKLQGHIGKFGKVELSDISSFVELPDGKVVSGTESGALLLWEGNFIKCRFTREHGKLCHDGEITYVEIDREDGLLVTAALDGVIRWWNMSLIDTAEVDSDNSMDFVLTPVAEYIVTVPDAIGRYHESSIDQKINKPIGIKTLLDSGKTDRGERYYIVIDAQGHLSTVRFKLPATESPEEIGNSSELMIGIPEDATVTKLSDFHFSNITGLDTAPSAHLAATCGSDGTVRYWNYLDRQYLGSSTFHCAATVLRWVPSCIDTTGLMTAIGFVDGVVRVLMYTGPNEDEESYKPPSYTTLAMSFKPHNTPITDMCFSNNGRYLATAGTDGTIFFFDCMKTTETNSWTPLKFINIANCCDSSTSIICNHISWRAQDDKILIVCNDEKVREIQVAPLLDGTVKMTNAETFAWKLEVKEINLLTTANGCPLHQEQTGSYSEDKNDDTSKPEPPPLIPAKATTSIYFNRGNGNEPSDILVGAVAGSASQLLMCNFTNEKPICELKIGLHATESKEFSKAPIMTTMQYSRSGRIIIMGTVLGNVIVRPIEYIESFLRLEAHNEFSGLGVTVATTSFDDNFVLSVGADGILQVYRLNYDRLFTFAAKLSSDVKKSLYPDELVKKVEPGSLDYDYIAVMSASTFLDSFPELENTTTLPDGHLPKIYPADDLLPSAYSIEEAKQRIEEDGKKSAADIKKDKVRAIVKALQREYEHIVFMNSKLPQQVQLHSQDLMVDADYVLMLKHKGEARLVEVHKECAYEAEKAGKLLKKVSNRLMGRLLVEEIPLRSLKSRRPIVVHSLKTRALDPALEELLHHIHSLARKGMMDDARRLANSATLKRSKSSYEGEGGEVGQALDDRNEVLIRGGNAAARREQRKLRKLKLESHNLLKPKEDQDDERDIRALQLAEKTIGLFKLKCSDDYEVPEEQRVNAEKKRRQMVSLEEAMIMTRLKFNERFFALRQLKKHLIETVCHDNKRIQEIDLELQQPEASKDLWEPKLDPAEFSDDREEVTEADLAHYKALRAKTPWNAVTPPSNKIITGMKTIIKYDNDAGNYVVQRVKPTSDYSVSSILSAASASTSAKHAKGKHHSHYTQMKKVPHLPVTATNRSASAVSEGEFLLVPYVFNSDRTSESHRLQLLENSIPSLVYARQSQGHTRNDVDPRLAFERRRRLEFERMLLVTKTDQNVKGFNVALEDLRQDRHTTIADLKLTELKLVVLFQEFVLLLTFEAKDSALQQKQLRCQREKTEIISTVSDCQTKLDSKLEVMKEFSDKAAMVLVELRETVSESNPFFDILNKIFKKKIKRAHKGAGDQDDEEEEEEEDDDDDDMEEEEVEDACPLGCETNLYEKIIELRERRLDCEEFMTETQKAMEELKKTMDRLRQREKQMDKDARQTEAEIQQFHLQKQSALNIIGVSLPICISQLYAFTDSGKLSGPRDKPLTEMEEYDLAQIAEDLSNKDKRSLTCQITIRSHLLFKTKALQKLQERIGGLQKETENARGDLNALHKERTRLEKEREEQRTEIEVWAEKLKELQLLKFGRLVDMDEIEDGSDRSKEDEMLETLRLNENRHAAAVAKLFKEKERLKDEVARSTRQNTDLLRQVAALSETKLTVTRALNESASVAVSKPDPKVAAYKEAQERERIEAYVKLQAREIESLKTEITLLKRKDPFPIAPIPAPLQPDTLTSSSVRSAGSKTSFPSLPLRSQSADNGLGK